MQHDNAVILTGTIPERPSWSETESGVPIVEFHLQVVSRWTGRAGQQCEPPMSLLIRASGHFANSLRKYWHPGAYVNLAGELQQRTYPPKTDDRPKPKRMCWLIRLGICRCPQSSRPSMPGPRDIQRWYVKGGVKL